MSVTNGKTSFRLENGANHVSQINSQQDPHEIEVLEQVSAPKVDKDKTMDTLAENWLELAAAHGATKWVK